MSLRLSRKKEAIKHSMIWCVLLFAFFPLLLMFVISFKNNDQFYSNPWLFDAFSNWQFSNWVKAWDTVKIYIANSIVTSVTATFFCLFFCLLQLKDILSTF